MRIRSIKPEFWRSSDIAALPIEVRLLFIGLWSYVDDNGVGRDEAALIVADLFAHDLSVSPHGTLMRVQAGLAELSNAGLIARYKVDDRPFLQIVKWDDHQKINRPSPGRYPRSDHPSAVLTESSVSPHDSLSAGTEDQGAGEQGSRGTGEVPMFNDAGAPVERKRYPDEFERFWQVYPRRQKKADALKAFKAALKRTSLDEIVSGAEQLRDDPNRVDQFTPLAASWLNADGWLDDPLPARSSGGWAQRESDQNLAMLSEMRQQQWALPGGDYGAE